jgi:hypothetical protein
MDPHHDTRPSPQQLRWFGLLLLVFCVAVGAVLGARLASTQLAAGLAGLGLALAVLYYAVRPLRLPLYLAWMRATRPLGAAFSALLLGVIYFLVITPIGLAARLFGRDALARRFDPAATSYWSRRSPSADPARYLRQS